MEFSPFTIIAGANASGKSNLFDALQLLSQLAKMDLRSAFTNLRGDALEQFTLYSTNERSKEISFTVELLVDKTVKDNWGGKETLKYTRLRYELKIRRDKNERGIEDLFVSHEKLAPLKHHEDTWVKKYLPTRHRDEWRPKVLKGRRGKPYIYTESKEGIITIKLPQDGRQGGKESPANAIAQSVLSGINSVEFKHAFAAKEELISWKFLQLNPHDLRKPSPRIANDVITSSGANLAASLHRIKMHDESLLKNISRQLNKLLPNFTRVVVEEDLAGNQFIIKVFNEDGKEFTSRVLSEGTLRLLTLCILKFDELQRGILCFEEPENGIHPYRLALMIDLLQDLSTNFDSIEQLDNRIRQVIVNTHSPILLKQSFDLRDPNISIWFSELVTQFVFVDEKSKRKEKIHVSKILPVVRGSDQLDLFEYFSDNEKERTLREVIDYLRSSDFEDTKKQILGG